MRGEFIVRYQMNPQTNRTMVLTPSDYHRVPDQSYSVIYDLNQVSIDRGQSRVEGNVNLPIYGRLFNNKPIMHQYGTNTFAGGRFIIYADYTAELTTYGSGVPILHSVVGVFKERETPPHCEGHGCCEVGWVSMGSVRVWVPWKEFPHPPLLSFE